MGWRKKVHFTNSACVTKGKIKKMKRGKRQERKLEFPFIRPACKINEMPEHERILEFCAINIGHGRTSKFRLELGRS